MFVVVRGSCAWSGATARPATSKNVSLMYESSLSWRVPTRRQSTPVSGSICIEGPPPGGSFLLYNSSHEIEIRGSCHHSIRDGSCTSAVDQGTRDVEVRLGRHLQ